MADEEDSHVIGPLFPEEVRWMYYEKRWVPFNGYDSLRIEQRHRLLVSKNDLPSDVKSELIIVRGGLYELDLTQKRCKPIYWHEDAYSCSIRRCTWFLKNSWQPLEEDYADQVEAEHLQKFRGERVTVPDSSLDSVRSKHSIHSVSISETKVVWYSHDEVYRYSDVKYASKAYHYVAKKAGLKPGDRICRGYVLEADLSDKPPDVSNLVFCVHGIGQLRETHKIVRNCVEMRENLKKLLQEKKLKHWKRISSENVRLEFLPVDWRSELTLDDGTVQSITPQRVKGVRSMLNSSALDVLYYSSPLYRQQLVVAVTTKLNKLYDKFCLYNPEFAVSGQVSVLAHSLGAVIAYDILTDYDPFTTFSQALFRELHRRDGENPVVREMCEAKTRFEEVIARFHSESSQTLHFRIERLYLLGSPLSVYLALRGFKPTGGGTQEDILPTSAAKRLFNIFHPSDPVAYRLEPLVLKHYQGIKPLSIHRYELPDMTNYEAMKREVYNEGSAKEMEMQAAGGGHASDLIAKKSLPEKLGINSNTSDLSRLEQVLRQISEERDGEGEGGFSPAPTQPAPPSGENNYQASTSTELEYRLDYELSERGLAHPYLAMLTSHTAYWTSPDITGFLLSQEFPHIIFSGPGSGSRNRAASMSIPVEGDTAAQIIEQQDPFA